MKTTLLHDLADATLVRTWNTLHAADPNAGVFRSHAWCAAWAETVGKQSQPHVLLVRDDDDRAIGLWPTCIQRGAGARWLKFLGRDGVGGDHLGPICTPNRSGDVHAALLKHLDERRDVGGLLLGELDPTGDTATRLRDWARHRGAVTLEREPRVLPYIRLPRRFDDYLATRSANMRSQLRRRQRAFARHTGAQVRTLTAWPDVQPAVEDFFRLHAQRWQRADQPGVLQRPEQQDFLRRFARRACDAGWMRCSVLDLGERRVGVLVAFCQGGVASFYQMGWDPDLQRLSPGVVLLATSIADAIATGCTCYDFLRGDETYKQRWAADAAHQSTLVVGLAAAARMAVACGRGKQLVKRVLGRVEQGVPTSLASPTVLGATP